MPIGSVIDDEVDDHANAAQRCAMSEFDEVAERAKCRVDAVIVTDVISVVTAGGGLKGHQPDRSDAETLQIIKPPHEARKITYPVAIGIHVGADGETIDDRVLVPEIVDHGL